MRSSRPDAGLRQAARDAITDHGYPARANTTEINYPMTILLLTILVIYVTMVYAPIAAWLVELFPTRIRYSGLSLPYHIGNGWFGGFLPATCSRSWPRPGNLFRPVVSDRGRCDELRRRPDLPAGNQGPGHHSDVRQGGRQTAAPF